MSAARYYSLVPGIDVVPLDRESVLLRSDTISFRLDGPAAEVFAGSLAPHLRGPGTSAEALAAAITGVDEHAITDLLDQLVAAGAVRVAPALATSDETLTTLETFLAQLGRPGTDAQRLRYVSIGVVGLGAHGSHVATQLAALGVGRLKLLDPSPLRAGHTALVPPTMRVGGSSAAAEVARGLRTAPGAARTRVEIAADASRDGLDRFIGDLDLAISCVDRASATENVWLNQAALAARKPVIYTQIAAHRALVGPLVSSPAGPCYLCARMRSIACEPDFEAAMRYEEWLDQQRDPAFDRRPVLPGILHYVSGLVVADAMKFLLGLAPPSLTNAIHEFDGLTFATRRHALLAVPDCPACGSPADPLPGPGLEGLVAGTGERGDVLGSSSELVSVECGLVRELRPVHKDPSEPELPYLYEARLANRRYHLAGEDAHWICSGKGATSEAARQSALGEAIERYGSLSWTGTGLPRARLRDLDGALDPRALVLFDASQYAAGSPYAPFSEDTEFAWVRGRDLVSGSEILVPAIGVLMDHTPRSRQERIAPVTSNGLGGGASLLEAVLAGINEILERDAFMIAWLDRLPARRVDPLDHPDGAVRDTCRAYARRGVDVELYRLPTDHPAHTFIALAVARDASELPAVVVGLGSDVDPALAARRAILEVGQMRPVLRARARRGAMLERMDLLVADPASVSRMEDHALLYASPKMRGAFDFLRQASFVVQDWRSPANDPSAKLRALVDSFAARGTPVVYCDLTPADTRALHLYSARAILPEFQPIHFGEQDRRLGGDRLFELPMLLGLSDARRTISSLNPLPHPLA